MPMNMILAGDVGGTKTLLEVGFLQEGRWQPVFCGRYAAINYPNLSYLIEAFLQEWAVQRQPQDKITRACFGVAGPSFANRVQMTHLGWTVDGDAIGTEFDIPNVLIVNDFAAAARGVELLQDTDLVVLQSGEPVSAAPRLVIGAGTGLGIAYLIWTGDHYQVIAGEAGHAGFSPTTLEQVELWRDLYQQPGRVSTEDVVSGPGLLRIHEFIVRTTGRAIPVTGFTPAAIIQAALESADPICLQALDIFIACYGAVAGDCALAVLARGGVYVTGGIAPRILSRLREGGFLATFNAKGVHSKVMKKIPVSIVTDERLGVLGCALIAAR